MVDGCWLSHPGHRSSYSLLAAIDKAVDGRWWMVDGYRTPRRRSSYSLQAALDKAVDGRWWMVAGYRTLAADSRTRSGGWYGRIAIISRWLFPHERVRTRASDHRSRCRGPGLLSDRAQGT